MDLSSRSIFLVLSLLLFSLVISVSGCDPHCQPPPTPNSKPPGPKPPAPSTGTCPRDALKLRACANVLNGLLHIQLGTTTPSKESCCNLIRGMTDFEAAACLCTAIKADVLGINLNVPVSMTMLLNYCGHEVPREFQCA